jgi:hypothetical protein
MALEDIAVVHTIPGRLRLRVEKVKGDPAFARKVQNTLSRVPGIKQVEAKPLTGSVLIQYELDKILTEEAAMALTDRLSQLFPEIDPGGLVQGIESLMEHLATGGAPHPTVSLKQSLTAINTRLAGLTGGFDLALLVPSTLLLLSLRSLLTTEHRPFPSWYDYLWFAFSTFFMLNPRQREAKPNQADLVPEDVAPGEQITRH